MIRINLLPFRAARKKENVRRQVSIFMLSLAFLLIIFFYYNFSLSNKVDSLNANIQHTKTELAKYNKINDEIAQIKKKLNNLDKKMAVMKTLEANRFEPTRLLDIMTQVVVPKRMWLTRLESEGGKVKINGIALDNKTVADFMVRLEDCGLFKEVNLNTLKSKKAQAADLKSFTISCIRKPLIDPKSNNKLENAKAEK
ncbi:MAG: PilN domain-containing protein [Desulfobacterales bacterium]